VIVPVYNYARFVGLCLESILQQTSRDIEIIIVDDASTDETPQVVGLFRDQRLRYLRHEENLGPAAAFNTGFEAANGEFIVKFDADDLMEPEYIATAVGVLEKLPGVGFVFTNARTIDELGNETGLVRRSGEPLTSASRSVFECLLYGNFVISSSVVARKACYDKVGLYDPSLKYGEDWDMWLRMAYHFDVQYIDEPLVRRRLHPRSLAQSDFATDEVLVCTKRILEKTFDSFALQDRGYSFEALYSHSYFEMLANKLTVMPARRVVRLYARGLAAFPTYILTRRNALFLARLAAHGALPRRVVAGLKARRQAA
jgi:glycosyltransferase involved in cell wall biosynthesis